jgi:putative membrane protein
MENTLIWLARIFTGLVAAEHLFILWMEMFAWETVGKKAFKNALPAELFKTYTRTGSQPGFVQRFFGGRAYLEFFYKRCRLAKKRCCFLFKLCNCGGCLRGCFGCTQNIFYAGTTRNYSHGAVIIKLNRILYKPYCSS